MAIKYKKWKGKRIWTPFYSTAATEPIKYPSSLQCVSGDVHKHNAMTRLQIRVPGTNKAHTLWAGPSKNPEVSIASHNKQKKTPCISCKLSKSSVKLNCCHISQEVRVDRDAGLKNIGVPMLARPLLFFLCRTTFILRLWCFWCLPSWTAI